MKHILIRLIKFYQKLPLRCHNYCRFYPSCSNYMIECLETYGLFKGLMLGLNRLLRCNPFNKKCGIDLVPVYEEKRI